MSPAGSSRTRSRASDSRRAASRTGHAETRPSASSIVAGDSSSPHSFRSDVALPPTAYANRIRGATTPANAVSASARRAS